MRVGRFGLGVLACMMAPVMSAFAAEAAEDTDAAQAEETDADAPAAENDAPEVIEIEMILYSNAYTALYEEADIASEIIVSADQFPDSLPVQVTGITTSGFYQVDVGGTYYIPDMGLDDTADAQDDQAGAADADAADADAAGTDVSDAGAGPEGADASADVSVPNYVGAITLTGEVNLTEPLALSSGLYEANGELIYVLEDGSLLRDGYYQYLYFDEDGYYTTGNEELDLLVDAALAACTDETMTASEKLRAAYVYIRDNYTYLSRAHQSRGATDWTEESAAFMLTNGRGNCYCFASAFLYMARRLGYASAYPISGGVGSNNADHAWVMITMEDGNEYMFDVELEYAYLYRYANKHAYNLYQMTTATAPWKYYFP